MPPVTTSNSSSPQQFAILLSHWFAHLLARCTNVVCGGHNAFSCFIGDITRH